MGIIIEFLGTLTKHLLKMGWKRKTGQSPDHVADTVTTNHHGLQRQWPITLTPPRTLDIAATATKMDTPLPRFSASLAPNAKFKADPSG